MTPLPPPTITINPLADYELVYTCETGEQVWLDRARLKPPLIKPVVGKLRQAFGRCKEEA